MINAEICTPKYLLCILNSYGSTKQGNRYLFTAKSKAADSKEARVKTKTARVPEVEVEVAAEGGATRYRAFFTGSQPAGLSAGWQRGPISARGAQVTAKMIHLTASPPATEILVMPTTRMSPCPAESIILINLLFL